MRKFLSGLILGLIAVPVGVFLYFSSGSAPVATAAPPMSFETALAKMAQHARMDKEMPKSAPITADEAGYVAGAQIYKDHCAVCHGLPGQAQTAIAQGMFPKPPKLMEGKGVTDDTPGETPLESFGRDSHDGNAVIRQDALDRADVAGQSAARECRQTAEDG